MGGTDFKKDCNLNQFSSNKICFFESLLAYGVGGRLETLTPPPRSQELLAYDHHEILPDVEYHREK